MPLSTKQIKEFESFRDQLSSFIYRIVTNKQDTEDIIQDTFIKASDKIDQFSNRSSFKTWVFTIATNTAKDNFKAKERWGEDWMDLVKDAHIADKKLMAKKI